MSDVINRLEDIIDQRRQVSPDESYVASLFAKGDRKIAEKLGEEAVETIVAAVTGNKTELTGEAADLIFHLLLLLNEKGLSFADIEVELAKREGLSGLEEKAGRSE